MMNEEKEKTWSVVFQKNEKGDIDVVYSGHVNMYELLSVLEIEREKIKEHLVKNVK